MGTYTAKMLLEDAEECDSKFFTPATMRFWDSRLLEGSVTLMQTEAGTWQYVFITSEKGPFDGDQRRYTVRLAHVERGDDQPDEMLFDDLGFQAHSTRRDAYAALDAFVNGSNVGEAL